MSGSRFDQVMGRLVAWRGEVASMNREHRVRPDVSRWKRQVAEAIACLEFCDRHLIRPDAKAVRLPAPSTRAPSSEYRIVEDHETEDRRCWSELVVDGGPVRPSPGSLLIDGEGVRSFHYDQAGRDGAGAKRATVAIERPSPTLTAEEFARLPDTNSFEELVRGSVVRSPLPNRRHGVVCARVGYELRKYLEHRPIGRVTLGSAIVTQRGPDTVRGADVSYYSFDRLPADADLASYGPEVPELVFEILSPSDRWCRAFEKVAEYQAAGGSVVVVLDPDACTASVFETDRAPLTLGPVDVLRPDAILPGFEVVVGRLFGEAGGIDGGC